MIIVINLIQPSLVCIMYNVPICIIKCCILYIIIRLNIIFIFIFTLILLMAIRRDFLNQFSLNICDTFWIRMCMEFLFLQMEIYNHMLTLHLEQYVLMQILLCVYVLVYQQLLNNSLAKN